MRLARPIPWADVNAQRQMKICKWPFHHLLVKITFVIQEAVLPMKTEYIPMILSGMAMAVVQEAVAASSTHHHGSASNSPSLLLMTLNSGYAVIRTLKMKMFWSNLLSFMYSNWYSTKWEYHTCPNTSLHSHADNFNVHVCKLLIDSASLWVCAMLIELRYHRI